MVDLILFVASASTLLIWLLQEKVGRRQMQDALAWCADKKAETDARGLVEQAYPNWLEHSYRLVLLLWMSWITAVVLLKDGDFALALVILTALSGVIALLDKAVFEKPRQTFVEMGNVGVYLRYFVAEQQDRLKQRFGGELPVAEQARSFFPVLFIVLVVRSFVVEPFQIPSASMVPSLEVGDYILVNKYHYGIRLPVAGTEIVKMNKPQRGDVMVFFPPNDKRYFIKRVVGIPGDHIVYRDKQLIINGQAATLKLLAEVPPVNPVTQVLREDLLGHEHMVHHDMRIDRGDFELTVRPGHYFVMGDNRDNSSDSRVWGQVPESRVVGKAFAIWMHWPSITALPEFSRVGAIQ